MKFFLKFISKFFKVITLLVMLLFGVISVQLYRGPINLDFLKSKIVDDLHLSYNVFDFETLQLIWDGAKSNFLLEGHNVYYKQGEQKTREAHLKKVQLSFPLSNLLKFKGAPEKIIIDGAKISIHSFKGDVGKKQYKADLNFKKVNKFLKTLLDLKNIQITHSSLMIDSSNKPIVFDLSADVFQNALGFQGKLLIKNQSGKGEVSAKISYVKDMGDIALILTMKEVDSKTFNDITPEVFFGGVVFDNSFFTLSYHYFLKTKQHNAHLKGEINQVDMTNFAYWKASMKFPKLYFEGTLNKNHFIIKETATSLNGIPISASTTGIIDEKKDKVQFKTHLSVNNIPFKNLDDIWPKGVANGARDWITENITEGLAPKAQFVMLSQLDFSGKSDFFTLKKLSGSIDVYKALLSYVDSMPKIKNLMAKASFDHEHFDIKISSGETHGLKIISGHLFIGKFSDPVSHLELNVDVVGGLGKVLSLVDHKPLEYAKIYGLNPQTSKGQTTANLKMKFPLLSPFDSGKIQTDVKAKVLGAHLEKLAGLDVILSKGKLDINIGGDQVSVRGDALLNGEDSHLILVNKAKDKTLDLKVKTDITLSSLNKLWHEAGSFIKGTAPLKLHYQSNRKNNGKIVLNFDLKKAELNTLVFKKEIGIPATLILKGRYKKGVLRKLDTVSFNGENDWKIGGQVAFFKKSGFVSGFNLNFDHLKKNTLKATFSTRDGRVPILNIKANYIDLKNFMDTDLSVITDPKHIKKHPVHAKPIQLQLTANKVVFGRELGLINNVLTMNVEKGLIQNLSYTGFTEEGIGENRKVYAEIYKKKNGLRRLRIQTEQGGAFLRSLNVFDNIRGGQFKLLAYHDPAFRKKEWVGKIKMKNFVLLKAPLLTRIFALFPTAGAELTRDNGMKFNLMKLRFGISSKIVNIHASRANGISVGFNLSGNIERKKRGKLNLKGTMIPMYIFNTLISKIPLLGEVISGGKNEGLFSVSFLITGHKDKPNITANPLSIITPGITRNIFPSQETSLMRNDKWIDSDEENDIFDKEFDEDISKN